jgi:hypothetical protein
MSDTDSTDADHIRREIEETRHDLADAVNALTTKLDVKTQAKSKATELKSTITDTAAKAKQSAPPPVQNSLNRASAALGPALERAKPYRTQILAATSLAVAIAVLGRRRARRST